MPKHGLSFKHFVGIRVEQRRTERKERSVNELLSNSRQSTAPAAGPPSTSSTVNPPSLPASAASSGGTRDRPPHLWEESENVIHPAELGRREQVAHARAARSVAGPAPPRSWRVAPKPEPEEGKTIWRGFEDESLSRELVIASAFLRPPDLKVSVAPAGAPTLVKCCIQVVLEAIAGKSKVSGDEYDAADLADAMLIASLELDIGLRGSLLAYSALRLPHDPLRLSDGAVRVLLEYEPRGGRPGAQSSMPVEEPDPDSDADWDDDPSPTLSHLSLATHPAPLRLIQDAPRFQAVALTTLDLAFATLPSMDKIVNALPLGLRALGLAGIRSGDNYASWTREMNVLARKMTVLHTLDISHLPILIDPILNALFGTPGDASRAKYLPSLRRLGMRGIITITNRGTMVSAEAGAGDESTAAQRSNPGMSKSMVKDVVNRGRKWVDISF